MNECALGTLLARSAEFSNWGELWHHFFFWFSDPQGRRGPGLNYAGRARLSRAHVLPNGWVIYDCRPQREPLLVPVAVDARSRP